MEIMYARIDKPLPVTTLHQYLNRLPEEIREELCRYKQWNDIQSRLFGKLIFAKAIKKHFMIDNAFDLLDYNKYGKPYIRNSDINFSISHSGCFAVMAIAKGKNIGIDIEEIKEFQIGDFENAFSDDEWISIINSPSPLEKFYVYWTQKESVAKADGRGLSIPLNSIIIDNNISYLENKKWFLNRIDLDKKYVAHYATDAEDRIEINKIEFDLAEIAS